MPSVPIEEADPFKCDAKLVTNALMDLDSVNVSIGKQADGKIIYETDGLFVPRIIDADYMVDQDALEAVYRDTIKAPRLAMPYASRVSERHSQDRLVVREPDHQAMNGTGLEDDSDDEDADAFQDAIKDAGFSVYGSHGGKLLASTS